MGAVRSRRVGHGYLVFVGPIRWVEVDVADAPIGTHRAASLGGGRHLDRKVLDGLVPLYRERLVPGENSGSCRAQRLHGVTRSEARKARDSEQKRGCEQKGS